jgi:hypothetical protein
MYSARKVFSNMEKSSFIYKKGSVADPDSGRDKEKDPDPG